MLTSWCAWGSPYRKYTVWEGTIPWLLQLQRRCPGGHAHPPLRGEAVARALRHPRKMLECVGQRTAEWRVMRGGPSRTRPADAPLPVGGQPPAFDPHGSSGSGGTAEGPWGPVGVQGLVGPDHWDRWKIAVSNRWNHPAHINVLELYAETISMSWVLRKGSPRVPRRFVLLQDSQVAVHAGSKGRSSSFPLLLALRRTAGLLLAGNLYADRLWIPSKANPADGPSRGRAIGVFDPA